MSKITLANLVDLQNETTAVNAINNNNDLIEVAFDNTLSRNGTSPNQMTAPLDMNSNHILNLPAPTNLTDPIRVADVNLLNGSGTINVSYAPYFDVKTYGAKGDGTTDDTIAIQAAIAACIAANGGTVFFSAPSVFYKTTSPLLIDLSAIGTRFQSRIHILGDSPGRSLIKNVVSPKIIDYTGSASNVEAFLDIQSIRLQGNSVGGSIGLSIKKAAFVSISDIVIESMDLGADFTDVDQIGIYDSEFRFNNGGIRGNASTGVTDPNSWTFVNATVSNNATYGLQINNANAWSWVGGSIQYNGTIAGGATNYGIKLADTGSGYGNILFSGMAFEGNGGAGDFISQQTGAGAQHCNVTFDTCSFIRTGTFVGVGYGTNQINISGTGAKANYKIINSNFYGFAPYAASAGRPAIVNTNVNAKIEIDPLTTFWSTTEAPSGISQLYTYREKLTAARDYYVRTDGSDSNTGLANTAGGAFLTLQKAADVVMKNIDTAGFSVNIGITGTFSAPMVFSGTVVGGGTVTVYTPTTAAIGVASTDAFVAKNGANITLLGTNITLSTTTSGVVLWAYNYGSISFSGGTLGTGASGHIAAGSNAGVFGPGNIFLTGNYTVAGGASSHIHVVTVGSSVILSPSATITLTGTPAFSSFFLGISKGLFYASGATPFSGAATGPKFLIHNGGTAVTLVAASAMPGSVAGTVNSGGMYNNQAVNEDSIFGMEKLLGLNFAAPSTPAAGYTTGWFDTTDKRFHDKNDAGTIGTTVVADTGAANQFLTAISAAGVVSKAQPAVTGLSDTAWTSYTPTAVSSTVGGTPATYTLVSASYKQIGKTVIARAAFNVTNQGVGASGRIRISLPFTAAAFSYVGNSYEYSLTGKSGAAFINVSGTTMDCQDASATTYIVTGNSVVAEVTYEVP